MFFSHRRSCCCDTECELQYCVYRHPEGVSCSSYGGGLGSCTDFYYLCPSGNCETCPQNGLIQCDPSCVSLCEQVAVELVGTSCTAAPGCEFDLIVI